MARIAIDLEGNMTHIADLVQRDEPKRRAPKPEAYRSRTKLVTGTAATPLRTLTAVRALLIGCGHHAARTYLVHERELRARGHDFAISAVIDIANARETVLARLRKNGSDAEPVFIEPFADTLPAKIKIEIQRLIRRHGINALIVATPPEWHRPWVEFGLRRDISVLFDKPVTSRTAAVSDLKQARGIFEDWVALDRAYTNAKSRGRLCAIVNSHRRWHPGFDLAIELIEDVRRRRECPVSYISAYHADGQWRFPHEIIDMDYHGYNKGNGKLSHSGYHEIDTLYRLLRASWTDDAKPDDGLLSAVLIQPDAFVRQIPRHQYTAMFEGYEAAARYNEEEIAAIGDQLGEIDAFITLVLRKRGRNNAFARIDLQHNSPSGRSWLEPRWQDLYKQSGRQKHEQWLIVNGPLQDIMIETYQADDQHDRAGEKSTALGSPNHFEVRVRRSPDLGGERLQVFQANDLAAFASDRLHGEQVKIAALQEFVQFVEGSIDHAQLRSDLTDHRVPASLMSAAYESHVRSRAGRSATVRVSL